LPKTISIEITHDLFFRLTPRLVPVIQPDQGDVDPDIEV
jgi:hypothetical protein